MMTKTFVSGLLIVVVLGLAIANAQVPDMINYQGVLTASDGSPIDTTVQMMFRMYADSTTGTYLWTETHDSVKVEGGMFNVLLGSRTSIPDSVFSGSVRYLGLTVGSDAEMSPRRPLVSVGYAFRSERADTADYALVGAADNDWIIQGDTIYHLPGNVGIGTTSPTEKLDVTGNIHASGTIRSGNSIAIDGINDKITATSGKIDFDNEDLVTTGNVGIGTTSPDARTELHVVDSSSGIAPTEYYGQAVAVFESHHSPTIQLLGPDGGCIYFGHSSSGFAADGGIYYSPSFLSRGFSFRTGGNYDRMVIDSSGNVGVGTTSPSDKLHVNGGNVRVSGAGNGIYFPDGSFQTSAGVGSADSISNSLDAVMTGDSDANGSGGVKLRTGSNDRLTISNTGDVGIGTTSPGEEVDIYKNQDNWTNLRVNNPNAGTNAGSAVYFYEGATYRGYIAVANSGNNVAYAGPRSLSIQSNGGPVHIRTVGDYPVSILPNNGGVGIGTATPAEELDVAGTAQMTGFKLPTGAANGYVLTSDSSGVGTWQAATGGADNDWTISGNDMYSAVPGSVGIGTISPTARLEVAGTIYSTSGGFKFPDGTVQTTAGAGGGLASIDSVFNTGGNVDLIPQNAVTITPNDGANTITIGETHSALANNPHAVTAAQTGALVSVDGVSNPGGNVDLVAGANVTITPDNTGDSIVISAAASCAQVFIVAATGGNFTTIGQALNACTSPSSGNTYLIRVMPGTYNETITCSSFVGLQGAGKYVCFITGTVTGADSCTIDGFNIGGGIICTGTSPTITNNLITNPGGDGILVTNGGIPWIKENEIRYCLGWGIHCNGWNTDAWIIANRIEYNGGGGGGGGVRCTDSAPTISNNQILSNQSFGIYLIGNMGTPSEPTIDDNVIGRTQPPGAGVGIYMTGYAEPRIYANDIWINYTGIEIHPNTQPSILANNLSYNQQYGIICFSSGASKPVVIKGNHIHSHNTAGLDIQNSAPIVTHNNIHSNPGVDIQYDPASAPVVSLNVFDNVNGLGTTGLYNVTTLGLAINP